MKCHVCKSDSIQHYRQMRRDGVWVVTARCENGHIPEKGKPFYSISLFDVSTLPVLKSAASEIVSRNENKDDSQDLLEWFEEKQKTKNKFALRMKS